MAAGRTGERWELRRSSRSYGLVLALIVVSFVVGMSVPRTNWSALVVAALQGITLLAALWTSRTSTRAVRAAAVVVVVALVVGAVAVALGGELPRALLGVVSVLFIAVTPVAIVRSLLEVKEVSAHAVTGALCIYLLVGLSFAATYSLVDVFASGSFFVGVEHPTMADYTYFSYITLTTVGYGDLVASLGVGRALAVLEALMGQIYLVTVVAFAVSNLVRARVERGLGSP